MSGDTRRVRALPASRKILVAGGRHGGRRSLAARMGSGQSEETVAEGLEGSSGTWVGILAEWRR